VKLIVTGLGEHGKDTVCELLAQKGFTFKSSSEIANEFAVFPFLKDKYGYKTVEECFADRRSHRKEWADLITEYNSKDKARLGNLIFKNYDIYCGLRNIDELKAIKLSGRLIVTVWVDAMFRKGRTEDLNSISITKHDCDYIIDNNGTEASLKFMVDMFLQQLERL
jgi:dephospho-CoA kinase